MEQDTSVTSTAPGSGQASTRTKTGFYTHFYSSDTMTPFDHQQELEPLGVSCLKVSDIH